MIAITQTGRSAWMGCVIPLLCYGEEYRGYHAPRPKEEAE